MEDLYKLQEKKYIYKNKREKYILNIFAGLLTIIIITVISIGTNRMIFLSLILAYSCIILFCIMCMRCSNIINDNYIYNDLKNIGMKKEAYITEIRLKRYKETFPFYGYLFVITIWDGEKNIHIGRIKDNRASRTLKALLESNSYHIKSSIKVPINIFLYKRKVYADLDSVNLTMVDMDLNR